MRLKPPQTGRDQPADSSSATSDNALTAVAVDSAEEESSPSQ